MKWMDVPIALAILLTFSLVPAMAQMGKPQVDPQPEEPTMARLMTMMSDMRAEMHRMQTEMGGGQGPRMQGMGPMQERMGTMMGMMNEMRGMMEQHREQMTKQCPTLETPARPKPGG
jgi:hypothetical protein